MTALVWAASDLQQVAAEHGLLGRRLENEDDDQRDHRGQRRRTQVGVHRSAGHVVAQSPRDEHANRHHDRADDS